MKKSEIKFVVSLDDENIPEKIEWDAEDSMSQGLSETKSISLSLWDEKKNNTLRIDLWTKEMKVDEMKTFFHQTLTAMTDTFERATGDEKMAGDMRRFCQYFAEELNLLKDIKKK